MFQDKNLSLHPGPRGYIFSTVEVAHSGRNKAGHKFLHGLLFIDARRHETCLHLARAFPSRRTPAIRALALFPETTFHSMDLREVSSGRPRRSPFRRNASARLGSRGTSPRIVLGVQEGFKKTEKKSISKGREALGVQVQFPGYIVGVRRRYFIRRNFLPVYRLPKDYRSRTVSHSASSRAAVGESALKRPVLRPRGAKSRLPWCLLSLSVPAITQ